MSGRRPKVVYWNHSPTPYFVERFNAIVDRDTLDFEAWFNERREAMRSWDVDESDWRFPARYIPCRSLLGWQARVPVAELQLARPDLLVQEYDRSHLTAGFLVGRALASRTAFRVLPNFDSWSERTWWREAGKHVVFRAVDGAKVPGADGRRLAERYGLPAERVERVTQSIDVQRLARSGAGREARRRALGLEGCVFIYVGRLWSGKGTDDLFDAYERVTASGRGASLLLLGDGPDEQRYRARARRLPRVVFAGFVQGREIADYYSLADAMVFPTLGDPHGLVVEEAMACGLPVICSSAAGDIRTRLPHGEAGYVIPPSDVQVLERHMLALVDDRERRESMGRRARELAIARDHATYAADFESFATRTLSRPARRNGVAACARVAGELVVLASHGAPAPLVSSAVTPDRERAASVGGGTL